MGNGRGSNFYPGDMMQIMGSFMTVFGVGAICCYALSAFPAALLSGLLLLGLGVSMIVAGTLFEFWDKWKTKPQEEVRHPEAEQWHPEGDNQLVFGGQRSLEHLESPAEEIVIDATEGVAARKAR